MSTPWTPRAIVLGLCAAALCVVLPFSAQMRREAQLDGDTVLATVLTPAAAVAEALGLARAVETWGQYRDAFYDYSPGWGERTNEPPAQPVLVDPAPPPPPPTGEVASTGAAEVAAGSGEGRPSPPSEPEKPTPRRILIVGASSIQFDLGRALETQLEARPGLTVERWGRHSTGLSRGDYFDWVAKAEELRASFHPDLVIAQMGGNDCQVITEPDGDEVARFPTDDWEPAYAARVTAFIDVFAETGVPVVFLGMPIMRSPAFREKVARLNRVTERAVVAADQTFISTWEVSADEDGDYRGTAMIDGRERVFRADDGIHLSMQGAAFVGAHVIRAIEEHFSLPEPAPERPTSDDE